MAITFGTQKQVQASGLSASVVELTATTAVAIYQTAVNSFRATHLTLTGGVITLGSELTIDNTNIFVYAACKLTNTLILLVYGYTSGSVRRARTISVSGTTLTANAVTNLTDIMLTSALDNIGVVRLSDTAGILVYKQSTLVGKARVLSISGTSVTENASFQYNANPYQNRVAALSSSKAVVLFANGGSSNRPTAEVLDISGTTITGNSELEISTNAVDVTGYGTMSIDNLDSSKLIASWARSASSDHDAVVLSESGGSLSNGTIKTLLPTSQKIGAVSIAAHSSTKAIHLGLGTGSVIAFDELSISGTNITQSDTQNISAAVTTSSVWIRAISASVAMAVWEGSIEAISSSVGVSDLFTLSIIPKPCSIDASGEFIYVALLNNGTPILSKISTALDSNGTTVFDPGAGDVIGVECGRYNADVVWIAGLFDGTNQVEKSEDGGSSFTVKNSGFNSGGVFAFDIGPDSDEKVIVNNNDTQTLETTDDGETWTITTTTNIEALSIDRLTENTQETVFGNYGDVNNSINYSINSGTDIEDYQTGIFPNENVTGVIVN